MGLVHHKAWDASGNSRRCRPPGNLAAATASAEQLGLLARADAVQIVSRTGDILLQGNTAFDLPSRVHDLGNAVSAATSAPHG